MARSRNIKPGFAKNEFLAQRSFSARLLFALLPTIADREGRLEDRPLRIKGELFPYEEIDVNALLDELAGMLPGQDHPFIVRYEVDGVRYIQIVKFSQNQNPHKDEKASSIPPCDYRAPSVLSTEQASEKHHTNTKQAPNARLKESVTSNKESGKGGSGGKEPKRNDGKPFDAFWAAVHHKAGKRAAESAYTMAVKRIRVEERDVEPHAFLLERMQAFAKSPQAHPADHRAIHPSSWLNQGRYDDDPETWQETQHSQGSTPMHNGPADPRGNLAVREQLLAEMDHE